MLGHKYHVYIHYYVFCFTLNLPCSRDYSFHFPNPLFNDSTEEIPQPENNKQFIHDNNESHEYAKISDDGDTIKSSQVSFDESRVYYNTNACMGSIAHYDTPKLVSKPKDDNDKPVIIPVARIDHHLAANENLPTDDEEYVPPQEIIPVATIDHHLAANGNHGNRDEEDCQSLSTTSHSAGYQELVGQRLSPTIYTSPTKISPTNF